jgi:DNA-binding LacI/PurR family transcriptional regulator
LVQTTLREHRADALVVLNPGDSSLPADLLQRAAKQNVPVVLIGRPSEVRSVSSVTMDNIGGAQLAMKHLFEHGFDEVAVITGPRDNFDAQQRWLGCQRAAREAGVVLLREMVWPSTFTEEGGRLVMKRWLDQGRRLPQAIMACNDAMALGALGVLQERGRRVPEDVALVGFDDIDASRYLGLTTVHVPMHALGRAAAELALQGIRAEPVDHERMLPTNFVVRQSCGCSLVQETTEREATCSRS